MKTTHRFFFTSSENLDTIADNTIDLVVTSPPYPMIEMWDKMFIMHDRAIEKALKKCDGNLAFDLMHKVLEPVWDELFRVTRPGGFVCINIGDATRTIGSDFAIYSNHSRIMQYLVSAGFTALPEIIWRKQTNAPNKFMGSGMLPAGAYVTLEHEFILIFRKGGKREFKTAEKKISRRQSAIFWEERNIFFSDIWFDIKGSRQELADKRTRKRSAAFPFELACRLINMYSVKGDTVLDPFLGTGTTSAAAMACARNSIGYEIDTLLKPSIHGICTDITALSDSHTNKRILRHLKFITTRRSSGKTFKHTNIHYGFPVVTAQEKELMLHRIQSVQTLCDESIQVEYSDLPGMDFTAISLDQESDLFSA